MTEQEKKEYALNRILDEKAVFVLDSGVFNFSNTEGSILERVRKAVQATSWDQKREEFEKLEQEIKSEAKYVEWLDAMIRERQNILTTREIGFEIYEYSKIAGKNKLRIPDSCDAGFYLQDLEIALLGAGNSCLGSAFPRGMEIIKRNRKKFQDYNAWLGLLAEIQEKENIFPANRKNDNDLISLSLASALETPTILLSSDSRHVKDVLKLMYGYPNFPNPEGIMELRPELPPQHYRVFMNERKGWVLRVDSQNPGR